MKRERRISNNRNITNKKHDKQIKKTNKEKNRRDKAKIRGVLPRWKVKSGKYKKERWRREGRILRTSIKLAYIRSS